MQTLALTTSSLNFKIHPSEIRQTAVKSRAPRPDLGWWGVAAGKLGKLFHIKEFNFLQAQSFFVGIPTKTKRVHFCKVHFSLNR
ncbi:hypothetical protein A0128_11095 [Leptospira tipperaryensis]|uniref:Uncharacterized protein n=1 Tax=Leptospira tipperaryensis TaxID=2564040 RepID=A0A1D7UXN0_9LEPT|nr:hypothetical protein A0128_11095 [Leptospira tipperaryensis]